MATTPAAEPKTNRIGLTVIDYKGGKTTLCAGCGHNAISERIIEAMYDMGVSPERVVKLSGIGCSSKSPAYFMNRSHSFNSVHGRMPSIASGALAPKAAVALSAVLNLVGAFMSTAVAATIAKGLIDGHIVTLELVFAGLVGGIVWNLLTWLFGIPSSSSHALIGGIIGATIAAVGAHGVIWKGITSKAIIPAVVSAILAILVGAVATWLVYRITRGTNESRTEAGFRRGQVGSASLVSLAHDKYVYIRDEAGGREQLYDESADPRELKNLSGDDGVLPVLGRLRARLDRIVGARAR